MRWSALRRLALASVAPLAIAGGAWAQTASTPLGANGVLGMRTSASPLVSGEVSRPMFNTTTPAYAPRDGTESHGQTVVAEVDGRAITLGEIGDAIQTMPSSIANMPFEALFNVVVDQLVRREALSIRATQLGLETDPVIRRKAKAAADLVIGNELLHREIRASITDADLRARYQRDIEGRPGPDEVRLRVIMVATEAEALSLTDEIAAGADFAALARRSSKDTTAPAGGDLGFMRQSDLTPEIGALAFSLRPGQTNALPIRRAGGWFIVKVEGRRKQATPSFLAVRKQLLDSMVRERVPEAAQRLISDVTVRKYDMNGNEETILKASIE